MISIGHYPLCYSCKEKEGYRWAITSSMLIIFYSPLLLEYYLSVYTFMHEQTYQLISVTGHEKLLWTLYSQSACIFNWCSADSQNIKFNDRRTNDIFDQSVTYYVMFWWSPGNDCCRSRLVRRYYLYIRISNKCPMLPSNKQSFKVWTHLAKTWLEKRGWYRWFPNSGYHFRSKESTVNGKSAINIRTIIKWSINLLLQILDEQLKLKERQMDWCFDQYLLWFLLIYLFQSYSYPHQWV